MRMTRDQGCAKFSVFRFTFSVLLLFLAFRFPFHVLRNLKPHLNTPVPVKAKRVRIAVVRLATTTAQGLIWGGNSAVISIAQISYKMKY